MLTDCLCSNKNFTPKLDLSQYQSFKNGRKLFGSKVNEVRGGWRKLHIEAIRNLYSSPNIIGVMKSRRMRWSERVARVEENKNASSCSCWET